MSRKRRTAARKPPPAEAPSFSLPTEAQAAEHCPRPNKWFLAAAILLEACWLTLLLMMAITG